MAKPSAELILALRETAQRLKEGHTYQWGHMGSCNCGHLAQVVTRFSKGEIHSRAMQRHGDWNDQLNDYCPASGLLIDEVIDRLLDFGFSRDDLKNLERLADKRVLKYAANRKRYLSKNSKEDVILYITAWAELLEQDWLLQQPMPEIQKRTPEKEYNTQA